MDLEYQIYVKNRIGYCNLLGKEVGSNSQSRWQPPVVKKGRYSSIRGFAAAPCGKGFAFPITFFPKQRGYASIFGPGVARQNSGYSR